MKLLQRSQWEWGVLGSNLSALSLQRILWKAILNRLGVGISFPFHRYLTPSEMSYHASFLCLAGRCSTEAGVKAEEQESKQDAQVHPGASSSLWRVKWTILLQFCSLKKRQLKEDLIKVLTFLQMKRKGIGNSYWLFPLLEEWCIYKV